MDVERRQHWDTELIEAVRALAPQMNIGRGYIYTPDVYAIIAAVEDWQDKQIIGCRYACVGSQGAEIADLKAQVQRVREICEDKYVGPSTEYGEGFQNGYNDALSQVLRALNGNGDSDE